MKAIVAVDKNWAIRKETIFWCGFPWIRSFFGNQRPRSGDGQKNTGELSGRASAEKQNEYCADQKRKL